MKFCVSFFERNKLDWIVWNKSIILEVNDRSVKSYKLLHLECKKSENGWYINGFCDKQVYESSTVSVVETEKYGIKGLIIEEIDTVI